MRIDLRRMLLLIFINFIGLTMYGQSGLKIITKEITIGKYQASNKDIIAREIVFPKHIHDFYLDTLSSCITVQLRFQSPEGKIVHNTGKMVVYDLVNEREKWSKNINYLQSKIIQYNSLIIQKKGTKSYSLDFNTGENLWEVKNALYYNDFYQKIGIGYKISNFVGSNDYENLLEGIDLLNGHCKWKTEISNEYGWNNLFHLNDSTIMIVASGLHSINVKNGKGWDYNLVTGEKNYTGRTGEDLSQIIMGTYTLFKTVNDVVSNVVVDSANLYIASKDKMVRLNHQGQVVWSSPLPTDLTSKSTIFKRDSIIYMITYGYAYMGYKTIPYGKSFIAAYHAKDGKQIYLTQTNDKRDEINGFQIRKDKLFLVFKDKIAQYSLLDGSLITEKRLKIEPDRSMISYIGNLLYIKTDSNYQSLVLSDTTKHYIYTRDNHILVINDQLELVNQMDVNELYNCYLKEKDYKFLAKGNNTVVIDKNNKVVANVDISNRTWRIGTKLYNVQDKSLIEVDINDIIPAIYQSKPNQ